MSIEYDVSMRTIVPEGAILVPEHAERVFQGHIFGVYQWQEKMFDGSVGTFEMLKRDDSVEVLVVHENKLLVQKQEQPHLGCFYSFPGGRHDHGGETEEEACQRELKEESGITCSDWKLIDARQTQVKIEAFVYLFVATGVTAQGALSLDSGERIENMWLPLPEVQHLIRTEKFRSLGQHFLTDLKEAEEILLFPAYRS
jgi:ADP-ribose pyrophosphatase